MEMDLCWISASGASVLPQTGFGLLLLLHPDTKRIRIKMGMRV